MKNGGWNNRFLTDLYLFYQYYVIQSKNKKKSVPAQHIKKLSRHLMALKAGILHKHLIVSIPPRHSKSSMVTLAFPLWLIFQNPDLNILIVTNTKELGEKFGIDLRELITQFGSDFNIFLSEVKHSSTHLKFCDRNGNLYNGSIRLTGTSGSITGQDADYLIIDDPYKGEEDEFTPTRLQKKIDWFNRIIEQRIEPHTKLIVLHTRWHSRDIIGYLKDKQRDDHLFITYQAISKDNQPLWPEKYTIEDYKKKLKKVGERLFSAIWQQQPFDVTSDFFDIEKLKFTEFLPGERPIFTLRSWDISKGATIKADYTVGVKMVLTNHKRIGVTHLIRGQYGLKTQDGERNENREKILETARNDGFDTVILIETGVAAAGSLLFDEWEEHLEGYTVHQSEAITLKVDRATPLSNSIIDEDFFINLNDSKMIEAVKNEMESFPDGVNDDIVDAISYGVIYLKRKYKGNPFTDSSKRYYAATIDDNENREGPRLRGIFR
ncbi:MAG: hypothetical protein DDT40_01548 [candidate division WS2 bacterium]|nr:hypothetical protein [Candidatus Psychracetigena formicireducens]